MHVGINLIFLVAGDTGGTETYARELVPELVAQRPDLRLTFFVNRETSASAPWSELGDCVVVPVRAKRRTEWVRGEQLLLPGLVRRRGCDLLHSLANTAPLRGSFPRVTTIHDLAYRLRIGAHGPAGTGFLHLLIPQVLRTSTRIIVPSRATLRQLRAAGVDPAKIDLVLNGPGRDVAVGAPDLESARRGFGLDERPLVLCVAPQSRHKNLGIALEALAAIPPERRPLLVVAGRSTPLGEKLRAQARSLGVAESLRLVGSVAAPKLEALYALAACVIVPSHFEGFGFPVLEAMARGLPVVCSEGGALPEVAGGAARLFPTGEGAVPALAAALEAVLGDPAEAERLREAGRRRLADFSWAECARGTLASYDAARPAVAATSASTSGHPGAASARG